MTFGTENGSSRLPAGPPAMSSPAETPPATTPPAAAPLTAAPPEALAPPTAPPAQPPVPPTRQDEKPIVPTRTGMVWVSICGATLLAIALIVFLAQNTVPVRVHFLGLSGSASLALMMLIAAVAGMLITVIIGSARIIQLRRRVNRR
jgi:putative membrane protein